MKRRNFLQLSTLAGVGLSLPMAGLLNACESHPEHSLEFKNLISGLLKDWCDGMLKVQINNPSNLEVQLVMTWAENNVSQENGAWTVITNPKSWKGITVFGAIALAEALHYHGHVLDEETREAWTTRLEKAGQYIYDEFTIDFTNINYPGTAVYGLNLIGNVVKREDFKAKTLNSLVMYALKENDEALLQILTKSLNSHLEFMLPDGAWDNSWGNRMYKWSYWGSRTCDGSQPAFGMMSHINPAFGTAAVKNTELLQRCTADGLIHGGPGFIEAGIPPCVHHTFTHAKPLAALLDHWKYDFRQASGGALGVLYHNKVGLLCAASMAEYHLVEKNNQQVQPNKDICLTPRLETFKDGVWYTNLYDLPATVTSEDTNNTISLVADVKLKNVDREVVEGTASAFDITYKCSSDKTEIKVNTKQHITAQTAFVLPIVSPNNEVVTHVSDSEILK